MTKNSKLLLLLLLCINAVMAQPPNRFNYQAIVRDASGNAITNQAVSLRFTIHDNSSGGNVLYQEINNKTTNPFGLYTSRIGDGTVYQGDINTIDWGTGDKFLQVEFYDNGSSSFVDMGTSQLGSVPYASFAANGLNGGTAGYLPKFTGSQSATSSQVFDNGTSVGIGTASPTEKLSIAGGIEFSGQLKVQGTGGNYNDILVSNGAGNPPAWLSVGVVMYDKLHIIHSATTHDLTAATTTASLNEISFPFTLSSAGKVMVNVVVDYDYNTAGCTTIAPNLELKVYDNNASAYILDYPCKSPLLLMHPLLNLDSGQMNTSRAFELPQGSYRIDPQISLYTVSGNGCFLGVQQSDIYVTILQ